MNKQLVILSFSTFLLFSCYYQDKLQEYKQTIENLDIQISTLQEDNRILKEELVHYKMTDQFYYQSGADAFINRQYYEAIDWMNKFKIKFPLSSLLEFADKIIDDSNTELEKPDGFQPLRGKRERE